MEVTKNMVAGCHAVEFSDLPEEVIDRVKYLTLDYLGVAARGSASDSSGPVLRLVKEFGQGKNDAVIVGTDLRAAPSYAAIANGTAAHSLELDDVVNEASLHPAVAVMSAALDAAHIAKCSGAKFIEGILTGYEVTVRLGVALDPSAHYAQGFHPTATCGTMGSAVAAAKILSLNQEQMTNALGIAGSQAAGSMEFLSTGAFTKRLHPGWAAHSGIMAALLAREGFTGPSSIIEGRSGFLKTYSPKPVVEKVLEDWGRPYKVMRTSIKPHSCCRYKQGPIDGILEIMNENKLLAADIEKVTLGILKTGIPIVVQPEEQKYNPTNVVDAQFSMPFGAAVAVLYGKASLDEYTQEKVESDKVKEMMRRISCVQDKELEKEFPRKWPASVTISTKDGKELSTKIDYPKGDPENPLSWDELSNKFRGLVKPIYTKERTEEIIQSTKSLENETEITSFTRLLTS